MPLTPRLLPVNSFFCTCPVRHHCCCSMVSKNREHYSILTHCMMEWLRAGPYNGKTTLNCEYESCKIVACPFNHTTMQCTTASSNVKVRPWKAGNYPKNRYLIRFRIVRMAFCIRDNHEMRRARASRLRCHHGSGGINKADSLQHLRLEESE